MGRGRGDRGRRRERGGEEAKSSADDSWAQGLRPASNVCAAPAPLGTAPPDSSVPGRWHMRQMAGTTWHLSASKPLHESRARR